MGTNSETFTDPEGNQFKEGDRVVLFKYRNNNTTPPDKLEGEVGILFHDDSLGWRVVLDDPAMATPRALLGAGWIDIGWSVSEAVLRLEEKEEEMTVKQENDLPKGYRTNTDGFLTNDKNWKPKNWLL